MNKRNVCQFFSFFFFFFFFFFFMQYLPPSWLGRVTRRQLFNSRTTRHIDCHKNIRNAGNCRHTLREWSLVTGIVLFHISVYQLRSPQKGIVKQILLLSNSASNNFVSLPGEKGIFHAYCTCQCETRFRLMGRGIPFVSRDPPLKWVLLLHGFTNEAYFS